MTTKKDIMDAYIHLRKTNSSIPDEALEFIKNVALEKLEETQEQKLQSGMVYKNRIGKKVFVSAIISNPFVENSEPITIGFEEGQEHFLTWSKDGLFKLNGDKSPKDILS